MILHGARLGLSILGVLAAMAVRVAAQDVAGDWQGTLKGPGVELRVVVHLTRGASGLTGTLDSPDQAASGIALAAAALTGNTLTFSVPAVNGSYTGTLTPQGSIDGSWSQGGQALPLALTRVTNVASLSPRRPQTPAPPYPYGEEDVSYTSAPGVRLAATLTLPAGAGPFPAVVLITGSGPQDRDETLLGHKPFKVLADHLTRQGIAVLRADDRGSGSSTGTFATATSMDFAADAEAGLTYLANRKEINPGKLGLVGHSEGGVVAPIVAARNRAVAFIVLLAGSGVPGDEVLLAQQALIATANGAPPELVQRASAAMREVFAAIKTEKDDTALAAALRQRLAALIPAAQIDAQVQTLLSPWYRYFLTYDPRPTLRAVRCPVLALTGEKDLQVPATANLAAIKAALDEGGNTRSQVEELPGLNHLFQHATTGSPAEYARIEETVATEVLEKVSGWILKQ
ncbi:MAG TPA: alpha/beta fold hydrolase [Vicinamibacterales bacterium]|jgi:pimeloyl-ACP methyl ester carboxylesterase|nr:alpha/beta fold hydrolase [Vicinamibacterales bacterium]